MKLLLTIVMLCTMQLGFSQENVQEINIYSYGNSIKITGVEVNASMEVYNLIGKTVLKKNMVEGNETIPMPHLPSGYYFVKLSMKEEVKTVKVYLTEGN